MAGCASGCSLRLTREAPLTPGCSATAPVLRTSPFASVLKVEPEGRRPSHRNARSSRRPTLASGSGDWERRRDSVDDAEPKAEASRRERPLEPPLDARLWERRPGEDVGIRSTMPSRRRRQRDGNARSSRRSPLASGSGDWERRGDSVDDAEPKAEAARRERPLEPPPDARLWERRLGETWGFGRRCRAEGGGSATGTPARAAARRSPSGAETGRDVGIRSTMPSRRRRQRDGNARSSRQATLASGSADWERRGDSV